MVNAGGRVYGSCALPRILATSPDVLSPRIAVPACPVRASVGRTDKPHSWERHGLRQWIEAAEKRLHRNVLCDRVRQQVGAHRLERSGSWPNFKARPTLPSAA